VAEALIPVSAGELVDKITILEIKSERMTDPQKLRNVRLELETLRRAWEESPLAKAKVSGQLRKLKTINAQLWEIEDRIRVKESTGSFDGEFIELARSIYLTNDERARVKREINELLGSSLIEEKSYASHRRTSQ
jgi:predicted  nucleic acid-binding Zn-ribbon protein